MAVVVTTTNPSDLLDAIYKAIDDDEIKTWSYDDDGDFTHTPNQWKQKAWMRPQVARGELRFGILKRTDQTMSRLVYAVFHGRFIEMLLNHFDLQFTEARATAQKEDPDIF